MSLNDFHVGDRVIRRETFSADSLLRHGIVVERYLGVPTGNGHPAPTLYAVQWDGSERIHRGYLVLEPEPVAV